MLRVQYMLLWSYWSFSHASHWNVVTYFVRWSAVHQTMIFMNSERTQFLVYNKPVTEIRFEYLMLIKTTCFTCLGTFHENKYTLCKSNKNMCRTVWVVNCIEFYTALDETSLVPCRKYCFSLRNRFQTSYTSCFPVEGMLLTMNTSITVELKDFQKN